MKTLARKVFRYLVPLLYLAFAIKSLLEGYDVEALLLILLAWVSELDRTYSRLLRDLANIGEKANYDS